MTNKPIAVDLAEQPDSACSNNCLFCFLKPDQELVKGLDKDLDELRTQFKGLQEDAAANSQLTQVVGRLEMIAKTLNRAKQRSQELTADVVLPPKETMNVHLVPSHLLDRLEEYRSDENKAYLLIGAFFGAILGILSNWSTDQNFTITRPSLVFMGVFFVLAILSMGWAWLISRRAQIVKTQMLATRDNTNI